MKEETRQVVFETNGKTYKELYDNIIEENLRNPPPEGENTIEHHIRPRSISPDLIYSRENLVMLTEKDHLLVHYLLWQHYKHETDDEDSERKMCAAFWGMVHLIEWKGNTELEWIADRYEELRVDFRKNHPMKNPEVKAKMLAKMLETMNRPDVKAKIKEALKNPEVKAKMSKAKKEMWKRPEMIAKISEVKAKMSKAKKEMWKRPEVRAKMSEAKKGVKNPSKRPEVRAKISEALKNPEVREKMSRKVLQYLLDGTFVAEYPSLTEAAIKTNSHCSAISRCCAGKQKTHNGFVWKYAESK